MKTALLNSRYEKISSYDKDGHYEKRSSYANSQDYEKTFYYEKRSSYANHHKHEKTFYYLNNNSYLKDSSYEKTFYYSKALNYEKRFYYEKVFYYFVVALLAVLTLGACQDEIKFGEGEETVQFSLQLPQTKKSPQTYGVIVGDDSTIETIDILLFDASDKYTYQPIYINDITDVSNDPVTKSFSARLPVGYYKSVVFIVNARTQLTSVMSTFTVGDTKASVLAKIKVDHGDKWIIDSRSEAYRPIPMWSEKSMNVVQGMGMQSITLVRALAMVDVLVASNAQSAFKLSSVRLYNYYDKVRVAPSDWDSVNKKVSVPTIPEGAVKPKNPAGSPIFYNAMELTEQYKSIESRIYTSEALQGSDSELTSNTCLVVGGAYGTDTHETFYRIDFVQSTTYLPILRNHQYKVTINSVSSPGFLSPEEAFNSVPINMTSDITVWNGKDVDVAFDGQYNVKFSQSEFDFFYIDYDNSSTGNKLTITTDHPAGWEFEKAINPADGHQIAWVLPQDTVGGPGTSTVTLNVTENVWYAPHDADLYFKVGNLSYVIKVSQAGGEKLASANTYLVKPNHQILFTAGRNHYYATQSGAVQLGASDVFTPAVLWTDNSKGVGKTSTIRAVSKSGNGTGGWVVVNAGPEVGNAVVVIRNAANQILYAWHIWVTDYVPDPSKNGGFMDRNLGAKNATKGNIGARGLLYQWGRSHPFPASAAASGTGEPNMYRADGTSFTLTKTQVGAGSNWSAWRNPVTYYYGQSTVYNWLAPTSAGSSNLWNTNNDVYGPCPDGWKVPSSQDFGTLNNTNFAWDGTNKGRNHTTYGWFPAGGVRLSDNGNLYTVGETGSYWLQSVVTPEASPYYVHQLNFNAAGIFIPYGGYRASGFSVRCIRK